MSVQYNFFRVPVVDSREIQDEINQFLRSVDVVQVKKEFVGQGRESFWALAVEYLSGNHSNSSGKKKTVDYKAVLSPDDFAVYARLRDWRKDRAAQEGVPPYVIFTNEQLAEIVEKGIGSLNSLGQLPGIGEARIKKYGKEILGVLGQTNDGQSKG